MVKPFSVATLVGVAALAIGSGQGRALEIIAISCDEWIQGRRSGHAGFHEGYAIGVITGVQNSRNLEFWSIDGTRVSPEQAFMYLDKYCSESPLSNVPYGVVNLFAIRNGDAPPFE